LVTVGVLALQGAVGLHTQILRRLGASTLEVRTPDELAAVDALVLPGGESTTMARLLVLNQLAEPLGERLTEGMPVLGTCAGMILLATNVLDGREDQRSFGAIDIDVRRNAFGRQVDSFEADLDVVGIDGDPVHAVFIRAPFVERVGPGVEVLASVAGHPVCCREGAVVVTAFHPELADDPRIHESFLSMVDTAGPTGG
jgi:5'-phosphate synthase pdxT subunit